MGQVARRQFQAQGKSSKELAEHHRRSIQVGVILNRLQKYVLNEKENNSSEAVKMTPTQVKAAGILLSKTMPDLQSVDSNLSLEQKVTPKELIDRLYKMSDDLGVPLERIAPHVGVTMDQLRVLEATYGTKLINPKDED